jgi:hypothetical protein
MSGVTDNVLSRVDDGPEHVEEPIEVRARRLGWKPREEFASGPPQNWKTAEEFVEAGDRELPLIRANNRKLETQVSRLSRDLTAVTESLAHMTEMQQKAYERAYKKAREDLERQRDAAVEGADRAAFAAAEKGLKELDAEAPKPPPKPVQPRVAEPPPEVLEWSDQNPWFLADATLREKAERIHMRIQQARPGLSLRENLAEVTAEMRRQHPEIAGENPRRNGAAEVSGAGTDNGPTRRSGAKTFDAMPADSKAAYERYAKAMKARGGALTKEQWAADYWDQE